MDAGAAPHPLELTFNSYLLNGGGRRSPPLEYLVTFEDGRSVIVKAVYEKNSHPTYPPVDSSATARLAVETLGIRQPFKKRKEYMRVSISPLSVSGGKVVVGDGYTRFMIRVPHEPGTVQDWNDEVETLLNKVPTEVRAELLGLAYDLGYPKGMQEVLDQLETLVDRLGCAINNIGK